MKAAHTKLSFDLRALSVPMVDVVIPVLNEEESIERCIIRLLEVGWKTDSIIVVDGGSQDHTIERVQQLGVPLLKATKGRASQLNTGALAGRGNALLFLHADTLVEKGSLENLVSALRNGAIGGCFQRRFDSASPILWLGSWLAAWRVKLFGITYGDQAMWVRRDVFEHTGHVPQQDHFEDVEMGLRWKALSRLEILTPPIRTSARRFGKTPLPTLVRDALRTLYYVAIRALTR